MSLLFTKLSVFMTREWLTYSNDYKSRGGRAQCLEYGISTRCLNLHDQLGVETPALELFQLPFQLAACSRDDICEHKNSDIRFDILHRVVSRPSPPEQ